MSFHNHFHTPTISRASPPGAGREFFALYGFAVFGGASAIYTTFFAGRDAESAASEFAVAEDIKVPRDDLKRLNGGRNARPRIKNL